MSLYSSIPSAPPGAQEFLSSLTIFANLEPEQLEQISLRVHQRLKDPLVTHAGQRLAADTVDTRRSGVDGQVDDRSEEITRELLAIAEQIGSMPLVSHSAMMECRTA